MRQVIVRQMRRRRRGDDGSMCRSNQRSAMATAAASMRDEGSAQQVQWDGVA